MDFSWAENYPDIHRICVLFDRTELRNPLRFCYKPLKGYIQEGPQCGLVALAIGMGTPNKEIVGKLFESALELNYTSFGEIFSAKYMQHLAELHFEDAEDIRVYEGHLNTKEIKDFLLDGGMILVPFDSDVTNNPGTFNGHKAHWAIILGAIESEDNFFVIARHGKARNVGIWDLEALDRSNSQLNEFSPDRKLTETLPEGGIDGKRYKLPEGGINGPDGLNLQSVLISLSSS